MAQDRINVLWIITDEQRVDSLRCYGSRWAHSPNLDALAERGVRFSNCTIQSPVCVPSRTTILTGRYAHAMGILENNRTPLPREIPLPWVFQRAGYQVVNFGKIDYADREHRPFAVHEDGPGYGAAGASPFDLKPPFRAQDYDVVFIPFACPWGQRLILGGRYPLPTGQAEPALIAARAERFLREEAQAPFFLCASIISPHTPVLASQPFYGMTDPDAIGLPWDREQAGRRAECCRYDREVLGRTYDFTLLDDPSVRRARSTYYDLCTEVDAAVGRILAALQASGMADRTLVVFTSDHGNMLGEHGLAQKESFFDPVVQVPLIFSCPGLLPAGAVLEEPVECIDILPTVISLAGLDVPDRVHGKDLSSQMCSGRGDPDRITFSEIDNSRSSIESLRRNAGHRAMARTQKWKLCVALKDAGYAEDGTLYDLARDPGETVNLYGDPNHAAVVRDLKAAIRRWIDETA